MLFTDLGLDEGLLRAVAAEGYTQPTPIQAQAIPVILQGGDLLAAAQTGTGKTAAFTLPLLHRLIQRRAQGVSGAPKKPLALVLTPTRELAAQVAQSVRTYGGHLPLKTTVIFGGVSINPQIDVLRHGVDILVATPGRLLDHVGQRTIDLSAVEMLILDEADRMLDMGFIHDIKRVIATLPKQRQNLMFSATFSDDIRKLAHGFLNNPATIDIAPRNAAADTVEQRVVYVDKGRKSELLSYLISSGNWQQTLVFTRTKHGANRLVEKLQKWNISSAALHGNKSQNARTKALAEFKAGTVRTLVATDIAARGLDIEQLPHVVNFELPNVPEDYVHRIGRTGRAGAGGEAISLVSADEMDELKAIRKLLRKELPGFMVEGFELGSKSLNPEPEEAPRPPMQPRHGQRRGGGQGQRSDQPRRAHGGGGNGGGQRQAEGRDGRGGERRHGEQRSDRRSEARPGGRSHGRPDGRPNANGRPGGRPPQQNTAPRAQIDDDNIGNTRLPEPVLQDEGLESGPSINVNRAPEWDHAHRPFRGRGGHGGGGGAPRGNGGGGQRRGNGGGQGQGRPQGSNGGGGQGRPRGEADGNRADGGNSRPGGGNRGNYRGPR
ncbi:MULTISPECIES: DEAD/DEAH box helicase [Hydrocarboniphaga]|uniref:ATP-dependent RNA helicase RhlE n=1 Tax=Hydrocarboniphaga effusa AP103 TaxID=1172194 RepID=I8HYK7_9GAMM|nr:MULTISPECIES: DEAD/DEAH box helicase [Hydrocarboniphaga]EIT68536.1 DEAD/DEAH box helicase domain protein [Hydrocarboniphaga effusa AP103]MDZ4077112.1 DEAD/DEAH box helicase [Hydrocarboniphaga sp.]